MNMKTNISLAYIAISMLIILFSGQSSFWFWMWIINTIIALAVFNLVADRNKVIADLKSMLRSRISPDIYKQIQRIGHSFVFPLLLLRLLWNTIQVFFVGFESVAMRVVSMIVSWRSYLTLQETIDKHGVVFGHTQLGWWFFASVFWVMIATFIWTQYFGLFEFSTRWPSISIALGTLLAYFMFQVLQKNKKDTRLSTIWAKLFILALGISVLVWWYTTVMDWIDDHTIVKVIYETPDDYEEEVQVIEEAEQEEEQIEAEQARPLTDNLSTKDILDTVDEGIATKTLLDALDEE